MQPYDDLLPSQFRYETKIPLQRLQYQELEPTLIRMGLVLRKTYDDRVVHSIYLDTLNFDDYYDSVSGLSRRCKIRFRWYQRDATRIALEIKRKKIKVSTKTIFPLKNSDTIVPGDTRMLSRVYAENKDRFPTNIVNLYRPVLEVEYLRSYFQISTEIRITIDRNIRYRKLLPIASVQFNRSPVDYVVELKYPLDRTVEVGELFCGLPFRVFRHSKYVVGMDTCR